MKEIKIVLSYKAELELAKIRSELCLGCPLLDDDCRKGCKIRV